MKQDEVFVITINRELGSGGRTVGEKLAKRLEVPFYDKALIQELKKKYGLTTDEIERLKGQDIPNLTVTDFISDMGVAYKAADLVVSRAGAGSISEFCLLGKPVILVPSPNVAEDHQTKNAMALVNKAAALYVKDAEADKILLPLAIDTAKDDAKLQSLHENILKMALPDSADIIAKEVIKLSEGHD